MRVKYRLRRLLKPSAKSRPIRIAQVAGVWENCEWFAGLCRDLKARGYDVIAVIDEQRGDLAARLDAAGIRIHRLALTFATRLARPRAPRYPTKIPPAAVPLPPVPSRQKSDVGPLHRFAAR